MRLSPLILSALPALLLFSCADLPQPRRHDRVNHGKDYSESRHEVTGKISFRKVDGYGLTATLQPDGRENAVAVIWPDTSARPAAIDLSKTYEFGFLEKRTRRPGGGDDQVEKELVRIMDGSKTLYDASVCAVHRLPMEREEEQTVSMDPYVGHPSYFRKDGDRRPRRWPNDGKAYLPCDAGVRHLRWRCPECQRLSEAWREARHIPPG